jgi:xanthine dehydrogenase accessory factor
MTGRDLVVIRGGGDLASGAAHTLARTGFAVVVLELAQPQAIRRTVSFARAVAEKRVTIDALEPVSGRLVDAPEDAVPVARSGEVAVLVSAHLPRFNPSATVVVDARMAKRNIDTTIADAPLVIGLGPGFTAGQDCHAVIETMRGHRLGRVLWQGQAAPDTGVPGRVGGATSARVVRAAVAGPVRWQVEIGDMVEEASPMGQIGDVTVTAGVSGVVRGLISPGYPLEAGMKIADIDPRSDPAACYEISDKARLVGAGVLEAILVWRGR